MCVPGTCGNCDHDTSFHVLFRLNIYNGSPLGLIFLEEPVDGKIFYTKDHFNTDIIHVVVLYMYCASTANILYSMYMLCYDITDEAIQVIRLKVSNNA